MRACRQTITIVAAALLMLGSAGSHALLLVSSDSSIISGIDGSGALGDFPTGTDNGQFFINALAGGSTVKFQNGFVGSGSSSNYPAKLNTLYGELSGVTSRQLVGRVTRDRLAGVDLFISILPNDPYSSEETSAIRGFVATGGTLFLLGEHNNSFADENARINALLNSLGSGMRLGDVARGGGILTTTSIFPHPLTTGVDVISFAAGNIVRGGAPLIGGLVNYEETAIPLPAVPLLMIPFLMLLAARRWKQP